MCPVDGIVNNRLLVERLFYTQSKATNRNSWWV